MSPARGYPVARGARLAAGTLALAALVAGCDWGSPGTDRRAARASPTPTERPRVTATTTPDPLRQTPSVHAGSVVTTHLPGTPFSLAAGYGSIWVQTHREGVLYRINPRTSRATAAITLPDALCARPQFGAAAVWVFTCNEGATYKIDPASNRVTRKFRGYGPPIYGAGSLWHTAAGKVVRRDPRSGIVLARIRPRIETEPDSNGSPLAVAYRSLWLYSDTAVSRIDTDTNRVRAVIPLPSAKPSGADGNGLCFGGLGAVAHGKVWATNCAGLYEIDPSSDTARLHRIGVGPYSQGGDIAIASGRGSLWIRTSDTQLSRVDPGTVQVTARYPGGDGVTVAFNRVWTASAIRHQLRQMPIRAGEGSR
jgi:hypothetical protein